MALEGREILAELERTRCFSPAEAVASAATMNFVVWVDDPGYEQWVLERAGKVSEKYPCRLVVLHATDASGTSSTRCVAREGTNVFTERVDLAVGGVEPGPIRMLVEELMLPMVPTVLWWSGRQLVAHRVLNELLPVATKIVVDSSGPTSDATTLRQLPSVHATFSDLALQDLAWMRLAPWREMIAQFFDDDELRALLVAPEFLEIDAGSQAEAAYLAGWVASRLGWTIASPERFTTREGGEIRFHYKQEAEPRRVKRVALEAGGSRCTAEVSDDLTVVGLTVTGASERAPWFVPLRNISNLDLLERFILTTSTDEIFEAALRCAAEIAGSEGSRR
jgi:glucose-6-phosphate dehydrogenase assembly protein OpcA